MPPVNYIAMIYLPYPEPIMIGKAISVPLAVVCCVRLDKKVSHYASFNVRVHGNCYPALIRCMKLFGLYPRLSQTNFRMNGCACVSIATASDSIRVPPSLPTISSSIWSNSGTLSQMIAHSNLCAIAESIQNPHIWWIKIVVPLRSAERLVEAAPALPAVQLPEAIRQPVPRPHLRNSA